LGSEEIKIGKASNVKPKKETRGQGLKRSSYLKCILNVVIGLSEGLSRSSLGKSHRYKHSVNWST